MPFVLYLSTIIFFGSSCSDLSRRFADGDLSLGTSDEGSLAGTDACQSSPSDFGSTSGFGEALGHRDITISTGENDKKSRRKSPPNLTRSLSPKVDMARNGGDGTIHRINANLYTWNGVEM